MIGYRRLRAAFLHPDGDDQTSRRWSDGTLVPAKCDKIVALTTLGEMCFSPETSPCLLASQIEEAQEI